MKKGEMEMAMKTVQEYLTRSAGTEGSLLIPREIFPKLVKAVDKALIGRRFAAQVFGPNDIPGSSIDVNLETADSTTVFRVAEGAAVPTSTASFTNVNIRPSKYAVRPLLTQEMIEDSKFNLLEHHLMRAAVELAENENALVTAALDGAANTVAGGAAVSLANITRAMQHLEDVDFKPKVLLAGAEVINDLRNIDTLVEADKAGDREMFETGFRGRVYGMEVFQVSTNAGMTTTTAYALDPSEAYAIAEKRPITVKEFEDPKTDEKGAVLTQRVAVSLLRSGAVARITSS